MTTLMIAFARLSRKATKLIVTDCEIGYDSDRRISCCEHGDEPSCPTAGS